MLQGAGCCSRNIQRHHLQHIVAPKTPSEFRVLFQAWLNCYINKIKLRLIGPAILFYRAIGF